MESPFNFYRIIGPLGTGGHGRVFRAQDTLSGRFVALKTIRVNLAPGSAAYRAQSLFLEHELAVCRSLKHPRVVAGLEAGTTQTGQPYAVFEYVPGETLHHCLQRHGVLPTPMLHRLMGQALEALQAVHARGLVHRDVKPHNLMVTSPGAEAGLTLIDLGISTWQGEAQLLPRLSKEAEGLPRGTPHYSAPEQWFGTAARPHHDLHAWGLVVLECLTGIPVYNGLSVPQVVRRKKQPVPLPLPIRRHPLGGLLAKVLQANPRQPLNARQVHEAWQGLNLDTLPPLGPLGIADEGLPTQPQG